MLDRSLRALQVDYIDLWLVHWPPAGKAGVPTWRALLRAHESRKVRAVGVSNYDIGQLDELASATGTMPAVNQVPWCPRQHDARTLTAHHGRGVVVEGYSPLSGTDLNDPTLAAVSATHGVTPAQVVLRWHLQHGIVVIPRSADPSRRRANLDLWSFELFPDELAAIDALATT